MLFDSLPGKLLTLLDDVLVYPAHGAGSLCGRQMSNEKSSTIGKERVSNCPLRPESRAELWSCLRRICQGGLDTSRSTSRSIARALPRFRSWLRWPPCLPPLPWRVGGGLAGWFRAGLPVEQTPQVSAEQLHGLLDSAESDPLIVIDVRQPAEWEAGHVRTATLTPLAGLTRAIGGMDRVATRRLPRVARVRAPCSIADQASQAFDQILRRRQ